jgi:WXG100 family type VII secretion target
MAIRLYAVIPEMDRTVILLNEDISRFTEATENTKQAADTVAAGWEGDAREAFVREQEEAIGYYREMARLVTEYREKVGKASKAYTDTDARCAKLLRAV